MKRTLLLLLLAVGLGVVLTLLLPRGAAAAGDFGAIPEALGPAGSDGLAPASVVQGYAVDEAGQSGAARLLAASLYAGDALCANISGRLPGGARLLAASLADLGALGASSPFGRLVAQQVGSRLAEYGYPLVESRLRADMLVAPGKGEFLLSRDAARLARSEVGADYALTGYYERTGSEVFVSLRVVRLADGAIMGGYEYSLPLSGAVRRLFADGSAADDAWSRHASRRGATTAMAAPPLLPTTAAPEATQAMGGAAMVLHPSVRQAGPTQVAGPGVAAGPKRQAGPARVDANDQQFPQLAPPTELLH
ncbi:MAG: hypothetical protein H0S85_01615 [Desulfovibrionaceae bacterium]|nr:hypothetical protein [Desulfovibrionaceae bacterium]